MSIHRETYTELLHSMMHAFVNEQLTMGQITAVLWACAQPDTTEESSDQTKAVREALTDWSHADRGMLIAVEQVKITFQCVNVHGPCEKGHHAVQMTRVIGSQGWMPDQVNSQLNFNEVLINTVIGHNPDGVLVSTEFPVPRAAARMSDLINEFQALFANSPGDTIEKEVRDFRAELDELFPSTQPNEKGGSDESP